MSILQCDLCQSLLDEPVLLPCGYSICARHAKERERAQTPCKFCLKIHQDACLVKNLKLTRLIDLLNKAKTACKRLQEHANAYHELKLRPVEFINEHFDRLEAEVMVEKDRALKHVTDEIEARSRACLMRIEDWREKCVSSLDVKPEPGFYNDLEEVNKNVDEFQAFLKSEKISEDMWEKIVHTSDHLDQEVYDPCFYFILFYFILCYFI